MKWWQKEMCWIGQFQVGANDRVNAILYLFMSLFRLNLTPSGRRCVKQTIKSIKNGDLAFKETLFEQQMVRKLQTMRASLGRRPCHKNNSGMRNSMQSTKPKNEPLNHVKNFRPQNLSIHYLLIQRIIHDRSLIRSSIFPLLL